MQKVSLYIIVLFLFAGWQTYGQDTLYLDQTMCRAMAIENSEVIQIADETLAKAEGQKMAARSAYFPNIEASVTGMYSNQHIEEELYLPTSNFDLASGQLVPNVVVDPSTGNPVIGPDGNPLFNTYAYLPLDITLYGGAMAGVSAQQPLYAGGRINAGNKMSNIGIQMAGYNKELKQTDLVYQTDQAYYLYLSVKAKVKLAKQYQELLKKVETVVNNSFEMGMTNRNELLKVQVKYNEACLGVQKAETGFKLAQMALCRVIGVDLNSPVSITDSVDFTTLNLESYVGIVATNRVEYQLLQNQVDLADENIKLVRGDYLPQAGVSVGYNYFMVGLKDMDNYTNHGFNAMGNISIPITTFGERKGKVAVAKAERNMRELELEQNRDYLQLEIEQARLNYVDAYTRVEMAQEALAQADENMRISDDNYSLGMETIVNLLEAKADWQNAFSNKIDALTDLKVKESNLLRVSNQLEVPKVGE